MQTPISQGVTTAYPLLNYVSSGSVDSKPTHTLANGPTDGPCRCKRLHPKEFRTLIRWPIAWPTGQRHGLASRGLQSMAGLVRSGLGFSGFVRVGLVAWRDGGEPPGLIRKRCLLRPLRHRTLPAKPFFLVVGRGGRGGQVAISVWRQSECQPADTQGDNSNWRQFYSSPWEGGLIADRGWIEGRLIS